MDDDKSIDEAPRGFWPLSKSETFAAFALMGLTVMAIANAFGRARA